MALRESKHIRIRLESRLRRSVHRPFCREYFTRIVSIYLGMGGSPDYGGTVQRLDPLPQPLPTSLPESGIAKRAFEAQKQIERS
jgi:hypothetical protein